MAGYGIDLDKNVTVLRIFEKDGIRYADYTRKNFRATAQIRKCPYGDYFLARGVRVFIDDLWKGG